MSAYGDVADQIIDKIIYDLEQRWLYKDGTANVVINWTDLPEVYRDQIKRSWLIIIERELEKSVQEMTTENLRQRLPSVLEKVKQLWIEELDDKKLFDT